MRKLTCGRVLGVVMALGAAVAVFSGSPAMAQATSSKDMIDLRPKYKAGQDTKYKMVISQTAKTKSKDADMGDTGDENSEQEIRFSLRVKSVDADGTANVDMVYESVKMSGEVNGEKVSVDTTKPATTDKGSAAAGVRAMAGTTISMVIDKDGNIKQTTGGGGLLGGMGGDLLGPIYSPSKAPGQVKRGQSWTNVDEIGMGELLGPMRLVTTHTLESAANGEARVNVKGKIESGEESPGGTSKKNNKPTTDMIKITKSDHNGSYVWDTERGELKSMNSTMKSEIKVDMGGLDFTRTGDQTMRLERIGTEPATPTEKSKDKEPAPAPTKPSEGSKPKR